MPEIPEGAKRPEDHKPKSKNKSKAKKARTIEIEYRGETYTIPTDTDDVEVAEAFMEGRITTALRLLMGLKEYNRLKENLRNKKTGITKGSHVAKFANIVVEELEDVKN